MKPRALAAPARLALAAGFAAASCALTACDPAAPPPGPAVDSAGSSLARATAVLGTAGAAPSASTTAEAVGAGDRDFSAKIASIAMRTWVYAEPNDKSTKLGYLRAGGVVDRVATSAGNQGCAGGWYAVRPRGYVCVGKGASLDLDHPVVAAAVRGPRRGQPFPYPYVTAGDPPPPFFFRLPPEEEQRRMEGSKRGARPLSPAELELLGPADPIPRFLSEGGSLPKPYGAAAQLAWGSHRGKAALDAAFGLIASFDWTSRRWGLTTELDLLAVDRMRLARPSTLQGVVVEGEGIPAIVVQHGLEAYRPDANGKLQRAGEAPFRSGWTLTGKRSNAPGGLGETTSGEWLPLNGLRMAEPREDPAGFAREGRKWIDVSIRQQLLVAYEGTRPVFATLVSTGRGGLGDPKPTHSTPRGTFMIHAKHLTATMGGDEASDERYDLRDVPYVQYFNEGFALHGVFWHDEFGKVRSHGCINLPPAAAAWLFEWTDPAVPEGWHGAINLKAGTLVYVHG